MIALQNFNQDNLKPHPHCESKGRKKIAVWILHVKTFLIPKLYEVLSIKFVTRAF